MSWSGSSHRSGARKNRLEVASPTPRLPDGRLVEFNLPAARGVALLEAPNPVHLPGTGTDPVASSASTQGDGYGEPVKTENGDQPSGSGRAALVTGGSRSIGAAIATPPCAAPRRSSPSRTSWTAACTAVSRTGRTARRAGRRNRSTGEPELDSLCTSRRLAGDRHGAAVVGQLVPTFWLNEPERKIQVTIAERESVKD